MQHLQEIEDDIWIYDGEAVSFYGMPYTTRMTIIRLQNGKLWVHSPSNIIDGLLEEVETLGEVSYLISPNKIHHLYMQDWADKYPTASLYASPGLPEKRADLRFADTLADEQETPWQDEIEQLVFKGSKAMEEVVFFHNTSRTLILTDLIENFCPSHFKGYRKVLAKLTGILAPHGKTPIDWRSTFIFGKKQQARDCLLHILEWKPEKVILAHGVWIRENAEDFLRKSFKWLL